MATYNGEKYLREQMISILSQLSTADELIISDDGSTDNTIAITKSFEDTRIKIYHSEYKNVIYNFENALEKASGDIIVLSDQDDIWMEHRIRQSVEALKNHILTFSNAKILDDKTSTSKGLLYSSNNLTGFFRNLIKNNYIGATIAFRSELLQIALPFPKKVPMHDMWLGLLAEVYGTTKFIEEPLIYYRRHCDNVSTTGDKSKNSLSKKIQIRFRIAALILSRLLLNLRRKCQSEN